MNTRNQDHIIAYYDDGIHALHVWAGPVGGYCVQLLENMGGRWVPLGAVECWGSLKDIKLEYHI